MGKIIGIDISRALYKYTSGIEYYSKEITRAIINQYKQDTIRLYANKPIAGLLGVLPAEIEVKLIPFPKMWSQVRLALETIVHKPSVLFVPAHTIPFLVRGNTVVTVHDLGFKHFPELYPFLNRIYHNICMNFSSRRATQIIAISEFTKKDIIKYYPKIDQNKITVIYHGYNRNRFRPLRSSDVLTYRKKWGEYILFLGRLEDKKNIDRIVKAYAALRSNKKIINKLVLAGRPKYGSGRIDTLIKSLPDVISRDIIITGYIEDSEVPKIMRQATVFLFPSLFEGFGMPVLEAFASGVPVITSSTTSLPEVAASAAQLVNPNSIDDITSACQKVLTDKNFRQNLVKKGLTRASQFTWEKSGRQTLDVLKKAAYE